MRRGSERRPSACGIQHHAARRRGVVQGAKVCDGCHNPYMIMSSTPTTLRSSELDAEACCDRIAIIL